MTDNAEKLEALKPCPFDNGDAVLRSGVGEFWVRCTKCRGDGPMVSVKAEAIRLWNNRTTAPAPDAGWLDELEKVARRLGEMEDPFDGPTFDSVHDAMDAGADFQQAFDPPTVLALIAAARGRGAGLSVEEVAEIIGANLSGPNLRDVEMQAAHDNDIRITAQKIGALSQSGHGPEWRDISSAPKDGTEIILSNGAATGVATWSDDQHFTGWFGMTRDWSIGVITPTHWMPLPAAPSTSTGG